MSAIADEEYRRVTERGLRALDSGKMELDQIPIEGSTRWGLSLVYRPSNLFMAIQPLCRQLRESIRTQIFLYDESNLHVTIRSIEGFRSIDHVENDTFERYIQKLRVHGNLIRRIRISFRGIAPTPSGIIIKGYPNEHLQELRWLLFRNIGGDAAIVRSPETSIERMRRSAHASLLIYEENPRDLELIKGMIQRWGESEFGTESIETLALVAYERAPGVVKLVKFADIP
jgi:hypothetical protein